MYLQNCKFIMIFMEVSQIFYFMLLVCWSLHTDVYLAQMRSYTRSFSDLDLPWVQRLTIITDVNTLYCKVKAIWCETIKTAWLYFFSLKSPVYIPNAVDVRAGECHLLFRKHSVSFPHVYLIWNIWTDVDVALLSLAYLT